MTFFNSSKRPAGGSQDSPAFRSLVVGSGSHARFARSLVHDHGQSGGAGRDRPSAGPARIPTTYAAGRRNAGPSDRLHALWKRLAYAAWAARGERAVDLGARNPRPDHGFWSWNTRARRCRTPAGDRRPRHLEHRGPLRRVLLLPARPAAKVFAADQVRP